MKTFKKGLVLGLTACMAAASLAGCAKEVKEFDPSAKAAVFVLLLSQTATSSIP